MSIPYHYPPVQLGDSDTAEVAIRLKKLRVLTGLVESGEHEPEELGFGLMPQSPPADMLNAAEAFREASGVSLEDWRAAGEPIASARSRSRGLPLEERRAQIAECMSQVLIGLLGKIRRGEYGDDPEVIGEGFKVALFTSRQMELEYEPIDMLAGEVERFAEDYGFSTEWEVPMEYGFTGDLNAWEPPVGAGRS